MDDPDRMDDSMVEKMTHVLLAMPNMIIDQLPLEGLSSLMNIVRGKEDYTYRRFIGRTATQVMPVSGMMSFIKNLIDPTYRKTITIEDTIKAGIPGLSEEVKARKNSEGLDAKTSVWSALTPYKIGTRDKGYEDAYLDRLEALREKKLRSIELKKEK